MQIRLPQARDFDRLRHLLDLVASGLQDSAAIGRKMGAKDKYAGRHADYYREAAEVLGVVERRRWAVSARGYALLATKRVSPEERDLLREAVADAEELGDIRNALLSGTEPNVDKLVEYALPRMPRLSRGTVDRRVKDTLSWRVRLGFASPLPGRRRTAEIVDAAAVNVEQSQFEGEPQLESSDWPDPGLLPFNWRRGNVSVQRIVFEDLHASEEALIVAGYASLEDLCHFVSTAKTNPKHRLRVLFGTEPFRGRDVDIPSADDDLSPDVRKYWLERGISILSALSVLRTIEALKSGRVESRISRRSQGLHAKMFLATAAATIGSSNFTGPGLRTQLEANVRLSNRELAPRSYFSEAWRLGEIYWRLSRPFDGELCNLLETLLKNVTWQEALARGCAELLGGEWARAYLRDELGYSDLWPSQVEGIGQALYVLMEVGSVLIADATGSGKTKMGAWLLRALRQRLITHGRPISDPVVVSPPMVSDYWADELHKAEIRIEVHSQGALSSGRAGTHGRVVNDVEVARILVLDEAHNFINPSNRTAKVNTNFADHVVLFTATPISRDVSDVLGIADLLGADNLDDETLKILEQTVWRRRPVLADEDRVRLRQAVRRFTVRRTKRMFNKLIAREPHRYRNAQGDPCRYPEHKSYTYSLNESEQDRWLGREITRLARSLRGIVWLKRPLELTSVHLELGWTPESYLRMRLQSARALARHQVRATLRSSRAALYEHIHGTNAATQQFSIPRFEKGDSGDMLSTVVAAKKAGPPPSEIGSMLPDWLRDGDEFERACDEEFKRYRQIGELCVKLSDGRERAKVDRIKRLLADHHLVVAFDSRPITLFLLQDLLGNIGAEIFVATGGREAEQRGVVRAFAPGAGTRSALALCSDAMSEGINLHAASAVLHLDMPSVVRIAEQRVGRIDRMDSAHDLVEFWWPGDAKEFALAADEKLVARLELVGDLLGSNLDLPTEKDERRIVRPEHIQAEMKDDERQLELLGDAFAPVRTLVEGPGAFIESKVYAAVRTSRAKVVSAVAAVRAKKAWAFFTLPGTNRVPPRWLFVDGLNGGIFTSLDEVAENLRERLDGVEDLPLDQRVVDTMETLLQYAQASAVSLLPRRKQHAFEQMRRSLLAYRHHAKNKRNIQRGRLVEQLLGLIESSDRVDLDVLLEAWLAAIRPRWRDRLRPRSGRRQRATLRRLQSLTQELESNPLTDDELTRLLDSVEVAKPLAERVVAAIIGVPA